MTIDQCDSAPNISIMITSDSSSNFLSPTMVSYDSRRNTAKSDDELRDIIVQTSRRPSGIVAIHRPSVLMAQRKLIMDLFSSHNGSTRSLNAPVNVLRENHMANVQKYRNRQLGK